MTLISLSIAALHYNFEIKKLPLFVCLFLPQFNRLKYFNFDCFLNGFQIPINNLISFI